MGVFWRSIILGADDAAVVIENEEVICDVAVDIDGRNDGVVLVLRRSRRFDGTWLIPVVVVVVLACVRVFFK